MPPDIIAKELRSFPVLYRWVAGENSPSTGANDYEGAFMLGSKSCGQIYRYDASNQNWDWFPGELAQISVGGNNDVWGINSTTSQS